MEMKVVALCFRKVSGRHRFILKKQEKIQIFKVGRCESTHVKEKSRYTFLSQKGRCSYSFPAQDKDRRGDKMCAERHRQLRSKIILVQSPYFYISTSIIIHACYTPTYTHLYVCMSVVCMHACKCVYRIWMNINFMLSVNPNFVSMMNTATEIWFTKYGPSRQLLSFQNL